MAIIISGTGIDMGQNAISNDSQVEVQEQQVSPFSGFKNYIINSNFDIAQRGTIFNLDTVLRAMTLDMWGICQFGAGHQQAITVPSAIAWTGDSGFRLSWTNTAGNFGASFNYTASAEL